MLRRERGITALQLAEATLVSDASISDYEHQKRLPNGEALIKLADYFGVSTDFLLCRTNVRCLLIVGSYVANDTELQRALDGEAQQTTAYPVHADLRIVTDEELAVLHTTPRARRKRARSARKS